MSKPAAAFAVRVSPPGSGAMHLIWIGGIDADGILGKLFGKSVANSANRIHHGKLSDRGVVFDEILWRRLLPEEFPVSGPVYEISLHGSPAIAQAALGKFRELGVAILDAESFLGFLADSGSLDDSRAQAWRALLEARTQAGVELFFDQAQGVFLREVQMLLDVLDRGQAPASLLPRLQTLLARGHAALALRTPQSIALCGRPNAGKSTLFNALVGYERVLVSPQEGTTRDAVEEMIVLGDYPFRLVDTAGIRESEDAIEREGNRRALEVAREADLVVFVWDERQGWSKEEDRALSQIPGETILRFPFCVDSLASAIERFRSAALDSLRLPSPAPRSGPCPVTPEQVALLQELTAMPHCQDVSRANLQRLLEF